MLIYVCSSSHGFGHAARDAAVLQQLRRLRPDWRLVMSSQVRPSFLSLLLGDGEIEQRSCRWDVGMVQADALGSDPSATLIALAELDARLPGQIQSEARWIREQGLPVLILGDIPPAAAQLAEAVEAPLVWMSNFGWETSTALGGAFELLAERALESYRCGQLLLRCPFDLAMDWGLPEQRLDLVCSSPRPLPIVQGSSRPWINRSSRWVSAAWAWIWIRTVRSVAGSPFPDGLSARSRNVGAIGRHLQPDTVARRSASPRCIPFLRTTYRQTGFQLLL